ncbi:tetraspanin-2A [Cimex lectularius]|uniref:Tetraspanin n=1 Tax=Cimex lectularius TaxID=79782 RepID=A0A8I6SGS2_CIMLE|nr:tetraspanin-2A [Cimex lectularius]
MVHYEKSITVIRGTLLCMNFVTWLIALAVIGLCFWLRFDSDIQEWVSMVEIQSFYIGLYIIIIAAILVSATGFVSCAATVSDNSTLIAANVVMQLLLFILGMAGVAVLMDNSTFRSAVHPVIKAMMLKLIILYPAYDDATATLSTLQTNIGCCGAEGPDDYINLRRPLPTNCRDTVTGNAYYYGCADELTWFLEQRSAWVSGLVIFLCCKKIVNAVLSIVLMQILKLQEEDIRG